MPSFERVGFAFQEYQQGEWVMQGFKFMRAGCKRSSYWSDQGGAPACLNFTGTAETEGLTMRVSVTPSTTVDYNETKGRFYMKKILN